MPKSDTWPGGVAMEPLISMDSAGSCDSVVSVNSGFSEDSLEHLSAEERACLMFLEETIESLEVEDDSGLSNDEPDPGQLAAKLADLSSDTGRTKSDDVPSFQHDETGRDHKSFLSCGVPTPLLLANGIASLPPRVMAVTELKTPEVGTDSTGTKDEPSAPHRATEPLTSEEARDSRAPELTTDTKDLSSQPEALQTSSDPHPDSKALSPAAQSEILDSAIGVTGGDDEPETAPTLPDPQVASEIDVSLIPPPSDFSDEPRSQPEPKEENELPTSEGPTTRGPLTYSELENLRKEASSSPVAVDPPLKTPVEVPISTNAPVSPPEALPSPLPETLPSPLPEALPNPLPEALPSPLPEALPSPLPEALPNSLPEALPNPLPEALPSPLPEALPNSLPEALPNPLPEALPNPLPEALPNPLPEALPNPLPEALPNPLPEALPNPLPEALPNSLPEALPSPLPEALPSPLPEALPSTLPEALPSTLPEALPNPLPEALPNPLPEALPNPLPEALPNPLPEALPSTLPEALPNPLPEALLSPLPEASEPRSPPAVAPKPKRLPSNIILKSHKASGSDGNSSHFVPSISDRLLSDPQRIRREALLKLGLLKSDEGPGPALSPKLSPQSRRSWAAPSPPMSPAAPTTPTHPSIPAPAPVSSPAPVPVSVPVPIHTLTPATTRPPPTTVTSATSQDPAILPVPSAFSDPVDPLPSHAELSPVKELLEPSVMGDTPSILPKHLTQPKVRSATLERSGMGLSSYMASQESAEASHGAGGSSGQLRSARPRPASLGSGKDFASVQGESSRDPDTRRSLPAATGPRSHGISVLICPRSKNGEDRREALKKLGLLRD